MKKLTTIILTALLLLNLCACGQTAPTWQEKYDLGMRYLSDGNYEEAILAFTAAIEIDPKNTEAYLGRASAYQNSDTTEDALELALADYETVLTLDELCVDAYLGMANVYIALGEETKVEEILSVGVEKTNDSKLQTKLDEFVEDEPSWEPENNPEPDTQEPENNPEPDTQEPENNPEPMAGISVTVYSQEELDALPLREDVDRIVALDGMGANINNISVLSEFPNLRELYLSGNTISDISALSGLTNLTVLYLQGNNISDINALGGLTNLTELILLYNSISDISALDGLTNLTVLYLQGNNIVDISELSSLTNLRVLDLMYNNISDIHALGNLTNLTELRLYGNSINDISALGGLTNLTELDLRDNDLSQQQIDELQALLPDCEIVS